MRITTDKRKNVNMPSLNGAVVLVTGANGGIGTHFVHDALARGASKVYATARTPRTWDDDRIVPLTLDVTDSASIQAVVAAAGDVTVLINNAGALPAEREPADGDGADIRATMETNFFGPVFVARAFAPILAAKQESVLVDVHSVASWYALGGIYSVSKAALWSATNSLRVELAARGRSCRRRPHGLRRHRHGGTRRRTQDAPRRPRDEGVRRLEAGAYEVVADEISVQVKAALSGPVEALYPELQGANVGSR